MEVLTLGTSCYSTYWERYERECVCMDLRPSEEAVSLLVIFEH